MATRGSFSRPLSMDKTDDETNSPRSGYITPPLSPSRTKDSCDCHSPVSPASPRKARDGFFSKDADSMVKFFLSTPPSPLTKVKSSFRLDVLSVPEFFPHPCPTSSTFLTTDSPTKRATVVLSKSGVRSHHGRVDSYDSSTERSDTLSPQIRIDLNSQEVDLDSYEALSEIDTDVHDDRNRSHKGLQTITTCQRTSPLRSSQQRARCKLLSPLRSLRISSPDRFICPPRPTAVTRESLEVYNPSQRRRQEQLTLRTGRQDVDPFGPELGRSERLQRELESLREAHAVLSGRVGINGRNANIQCRSPLLALRRTSARAVWNVGGPSAVADTVIGVSTGNGGVLAVGTNAPLYKSDLLRETDGEAQLEAYEKRLATALDIDQTSRILQHPCNSFRQCSTKNDMLASPSKYDWRDGDWIKDDISSLPAQLRFKLKKSVPILPYRVLDAPDLRDDYYCSLIAFSPSLNGLAVGLGDFVNIWTTTGVLFPEGLNSLPVTDSMFAEKHIMCLDWSSTVGELAILAVGRADGAIILWSPLDEDPRFIAMIPSPVACVAWRPTRVERPSIRDKDLHVLTEQLLVGDEKGNIWFYSVEWPSQTHWSLFNFKGGMTLMAQITMHTQTICGLAWSSDGEMFASGGNNNTCNLFETKRMLQPNQLEGIVFAPEPEKLFWFDWEPPPPHLIAPNTAAKHTWRLNAAVKAIAFCPWQAGLIAVAAGSHDRCIHFYHTRSGACLASIDCAAQITGLVWSTKKRQIAATFGFAQPEHPYRIAVFAWPSCKQITAVPWWQEYRALHVIAYPGDGDGCIAVAGSDQVIRFYDLWPEKPGNVLGEGMSGQLGGSDIIEGLHGIHREDQVLR